MTPYIIISHILTRGHSQNITPGHIVSVIDSIRSEMKMFNI
jgi:hypothetical protein